jgi:heavy metal translocating P-type ATPase
MWPALVLARRYPVLAGALGIGLLGVVLALTGRPDWAQGVVSVYALGVAAVEGVGMVRELRHGRAGVDILAVAAILATVAVGEHWAAIVIVVMLSGGEALEDYAARRARRELTALLERAPVTAHRLANGEAADDVPVGEVVVGDVLAVRPGELVPVDGVLESGAATTDESSLTGESMPVEHVRGDAILSGSVNGANAVLIRATATAAESQYQRIVQMVKAAAESRAPVVRLADRYAVPFTAAAFALAGSAWAVSGDPTRFAEVLVVATPCPLLIAAPVAFIAGMSRGARAGVIVKGGATLESLARARTVAFDKTGTLTHGRPEVVTLEPAGGRSADELLCLVASAEQHSGHVLARAVVEAARQRRLPLAPSTEVEEVAGYGVVAQVGSQRVAIGKPAFLRRRGLEVGEPSRAPGHMAIVADVDGEYAGHLVLGDRVRENARATIEGLRTLGVRESIMLTGDSESTATHIADQVGIAHVRADCLPQDKVRAVVDIRQRPVIMVGDGVNDAPVLAAADIGIALGARGATAASESADVVIMLDDLSRTVQAVAIGRRTMRVALESIWLGIGLSLLLMVVAVFGVLPAIVGAGLQEVVDLVAILGALRALSGGRDTAWQAVRRQMSRVPRTMLSPEWVASPSKGSSDTSTTG